MHLTLLPGLCYKGSGRCGVSDLVLMAHGLAALNIALTLGVSVATLRHLAK